MGPTVTAWLFEPVAKGRIAVLRTLLYLFVLFDVYVATDWITAHGEVPRSLYEPLGPARFLPLPEPTTAVVAFIQGALVVAAVIAATGRLPRLAGAAVFGLYLERMLIAYSYGKVDHDRFAFLVALAVLPTLGAARWGDKEPSEAAGWAVRCIQLGVVATYFLAAFAKFRYGGGLAWLDSTTLLRAVVRRGTFLADPLAEVPIVLHATQYVLVGIELVSPLLFVRGRVGRWMLAAFAGFHVVTYATLTIVFLPHVMCLTSFLPLERLPSPVAALRELGQRRPAMA